jgi:virginiamycin B lyase
MRTKVLLFTTAAGLALIPFRGAPPAHAGSPSAAALTGRVTSQEEGAMEGVVVSAKKDGSTITVSVVSDTQGVYSFPTNRLEPGHYSLKIRAVSYDLDGAGTADVLERKTTTADLKLRKTKNLVPQLTNAEWMMSVPGTDEQKANLLNCVGCHTLERTVRSTHNADEFTQVIWRMNGYAQVSQPIKPQRRVDPNWAGKPEQYRKLAEYLATINLSSVSAWEYPLKTLPRPTGRSTLVFRFRRAVFRQARPPDGQGHGMARARAQARLPEWHARSGRGQGWTVLARHDVPGSLGEV